MLHFSPSVSLSLSLSLPLSLSLSPVSCFLKQPLRRFFADSQPRIPQGSRKWLLDQSGYPMAAVNESPNNANLC